MHWETKYFVTCFITTFALLQWSGLNLLYLCGLPVLLETLGILAPTQISKMLQGQIFNSYLNECRLILQTAHLDKDLKESCQRIFKNILTFLKKKIKQNDFKIPQIKNGQREN